jgi:hypothetical protein
MTKENWQEAALKKNWNSLSQFKGFIEREGLEKVISFDGVELETKKAYYGLYEGVVRMRPKGK